MRQRLAAAEMATAGPSPLLSSARAQRPLPQLVSLVTTTLFPAHAHAHARMAPGVVMGTGSDADCTLVTPFHSAREQKAASVTTGITNCMCCSYVGGHTVLISCHQIYSLQLMHLLESGHGSQPESARSNLASDRAIARPMCCAESQHSKLCSLFGKLHHPYEGTLTRCKTSTEAVKAEAVCNISRHVR